MHVVIYTEDLEFKCMKNNQGNSAVITIIIVTLGIIFIVSAFIFTGLIKKNDNNKLRIEELDKELFTLLNRDNFATKVNGKVVAKSPQEVKIILDKLTSNKAEFEKLFKPHGFSQCSFLRVEHIENLVDSLDMHFVSKGNYSSQFFIESWYNDYTSENSKYYREYVSSCGEDDYKKQGIKYYEMK